MLKVKDNVDLKELEKFGFEYDDYTNCWYNGCYYDEVIVDVGSRKVIYYEDCDDYPKIIKRLIKADLIKTKSLLEKI